MVKIKYPVLESILAKQILSSHEVEASWKTKLMSLLLALGFSGQAWGNTEDFHNAIDGLNNQRIGSVKIQVKQNQGGHINVKVGDFTIKGLAYGGGGNEHLDMGVYGPKEGGQGLEEAQFLFKKMMEHSTILRK